MIVGYFADGPWSHNAMDTLVARPEISIAFVCARYDSPDRKLREKAESEEIPFLVHRNINSSDFLDSLRQYGCDLFVSMSFNQIFKKAVMDAAPFGVINCHAGKLPYYRGRSVLNWALINDEKEFGVTVHHVDEGVDTGDIIRQRSFPITDKDDYRTLLERAYVGCAEVLDEAIGDILEGTVDRTAQDQINPFGIYCVGRGPGDERLNWNQTSRQIFNFVRAICPPGPSARCFRGDHEMRVHKVEHLVDAPSYIGVPGAILAKDKKSFLVKTSDSYVRIVDWDADFTPRVGDRLN